jgi:hypothetical protein
VALKGIVDWLGVVFILLFLKLFIFLDDNIIFLHQYF